MKKLIFLPLLFALVLAHAQTPTPSQRSPVSVIPIDANAWFKALKIPVYQDSAHAFAAMGIDSIGYIFKELKTSNVWIRDSNLVAGGHKWTLLGNGPGITQVFNKYATIITASDSISVDTSLVASKIWTNAHFLQAETDPVAALKTITVNQTSQRGIIVGGSAAQQLGTNPAWTIAPDTTVLLTTAVAANTYLPFTWNGNQIVVGNGNTAILNNAFIKFAWPAGHGNLLVKGPSLTFTDTSAGYAFQVGLSTSASSAVYAINNSSKAFGHGLNIYGDSVGLFVDGGTPTYFKSNGSAIFNAGVTLTAPSLGDNSTRAITSAWANSTFMPLGGSYHLVIQAGGGPGDTTLVTAHDSTIVVAAVRDSGVFHHYVNPDGSYTLYVANTGGGGVTQNLSFAGSATADTVNISAGGTPAIIPSYSHTRAGVVPASVGARLDSIIYLVRGPGHNIVRASYTKDTIEYKGLIIEDTTHKLNITLRGGDTTNVLDFNIDASGLAGTGTVDSVTISGSGAPIFTVTPSGNNTVNPSFNFAISSACAGCFLYNNTGGLAPPVYALPSLTGPSFANEATAIQLLHGNAIGNLFFGPVNMPTDVTGVMNAAQFPALTGPVTTVAGSLATSITNLAITNAMLAGGIDLTQKVTNTLPSNNGGTGVNNGGRTLTYAGNHTMAGAFSSTFTFTGTTSVTFPTSGTLLNTTGNGSALSGIPLSVAGTANQILVNNTTGSAQTGALTLTLVQNLAPANSPTFTNMTLSAMTTTGMTKYNSTTGAFSIGIAGSDYSGGTAALGTGILKSTTSTGALTIAVAADFPLLNQNTTGTAANVSGTPALPNGTTGTTQTVGDATTKLATDQFVANAVTAAAAAYYQIVQANGSNMTQRQHLNFGTEFTATDNSGNTSTDITVNAIAESKVTSLTTDLSAKAPLASPALTGTPTAPTAGGGTNTTQIATTAFVQSALGSYALLASPALTGTPTAPTAGGGTNSTQIATTAFVQNTLGSYAPLTSPAFLGTPTAPTAGGGTNTTQVATTAFVQTAISAIPNAFAGWQNITSAGTYTVTNSWVAISPPSSASVTLTLPASPTDGMPIEVYCGNGINTANVNLTINSGGAQGIDYNGSSALSTVTSATNAPGVHFSLVFSANNSTWYCNKIN